MSPTENTSTNTHASLTAYADVAAGRQSQSPPPEVMRDSVEERTAERASDDPPMPRTPCIRATELHEIPDLPDFDLDAAIDMGGSQEAGASVGHTIAASQADVTTGSGNGKGGNRITAESELTSHPTGPSNNKGKGKAKPKKKRAAGKTMQPPPVPDESTASAAERQQSETRKRRRISEDASGTLDAAGVHNRVQGSPTFGRVATEPHASQRQPATGETAGTTSREPLTQTPVRQRNDSPLSYSNATPALEAYWSILRPDGGEMEVPTATGPVPQAISTPRASRSLLDRNPWAVLHNSPGSPTSPSPQNIYARIPELQLHGRVQGPGREPNAGASGGANMSQRR